MVENRAAWILAPNAYPLTVQDAPTPKAGPGQVVLQNAAVVVVSLYPPRRMPRKRGNRF